MTLHIEIILFFRFSRYITEIDKVFFAFAFFFLFHWQQLNGDGEWVLFSITSILACVSNLPIENSVPAFSLLFLFTFLLNFFAQSPLVVVISFLFRFHRPDYACLFNVCSRRWFGSNWFALWTAQFPSIRLCAKRSQLRSLLIFQLYIVMVFTVHNAKRIFQLRAILAFSEPLKLYWYLMMFNFRNSNFTRTQCMQSVENSIKLNTVNLTQPKIQTEIEYNFMLRMRNMFEMYAMKREIELDRKQFQKLQLTSIFLLQTVKDILLRNRSSPTC